jgi:hypothetical protein
MSTDNFILPLSILIIAGKEKAYEIPSSEFLYSFKLRPLYPQQFVTGRRQFILKCTRHLSHTKTAIASHNSIRRPILNT